MCQLAEIIKNLAIACLSSISLSYYFQVSTGNIAGVVFMFGGYYLISRTKFLCDRRAKICSGVGALICSMVLVLGKIGRSRESILDALCRFREGIYKDEYTVQVVLSGHGSVRSILVLSVTAVGLWFVCYYIILKLLEICRDDIMIYGQERGTLKKDSRKIFFISFIMIMLLWTPYFIINFPGVLSPDSINQIAQIEGAAEWNDHHPVVHTAFIAVFYRLGIVLFQSRNAGVALYSAAQMMIMAFIEAELIALLHRRGLKTAYCGIIWAYYALVPFHAMYAVTMWKDILFAGFLIWFSMTSCELFVWNENRRAVWLQYIVSGTLFSLFRSNGLIVFCLCIPFFVFFEVYRKLRTKSDLKKMCRRVLLLLVPLCCYAVVKGPVYDYCQIQKNDNIVESLSIPMQHIARVVADVPDTLTQEEKDQIERVASLENIKEVYNCRFADPMKMLVQGSGGAAVIQEHKWEYLKLWFVLGIKHPLQYMLAEIDATLGYWYPDEQYGVICTGVFLNDYGIEPLLDPEGFIAQTALRWYELYRMVPILGSLFSIGTCFVMIVFIILKCIYDQMYLNIAAVLPSLMCWCTIMAAAPLHSEMRYVYGMVSAIPLVLCVGLYKKPTGLK